MPVKVHFWKSLISGFALTAGSPCGFGFASVDEFVQRYAVDCDDFPADSWDVAHGSASGAAYAFDDDFVMLVYEV